MDSLDNVTQIESLSPSFESYHRDFNPSPNDNNSNNNGNIINTTKLDPNANPVSGVTSFSSNVHQYVNNFVCRKRFTLKPQDW